MTGACQARLNVHARGEALVDVGWLAAHLCDPSIRVVEADQEPWLYATSHIPGAVQLDSRVDLQDPIRRDVVDAGTFGIVMSRAGIASDTTVVLYGDASNTYATYAFWIFKLYGHTDVRILDGGRLKWAKDGCPWTREESLYARTTYSAPPAAHSIRAFRDEVFLQMEDERPLVDTRPAVDYLGENDGLDCQGAGVALRGGHIPGARSIPWRLNVHWEDGTFKSAEELRRIYQRDHGLAPDQEVIVYGPMGEHAAHTWFVLTYLLGFRSVKNYDGAWIEWGNLVGAPIER